MADRANKTLPAQWWKDEQRARLLCRAFASHLLGLHLVLSKDGSPVQDYFTGCIVAHRNTLMWVTAGHVIDNIDEYLSHPQLKLVRSCWVDLCDPPGTSGVPAFDFAATARRSFTVDGIDVGAISLHNAGMMLAGNPNLTR